MHGILRSLTLSSLNSVVCLKLFHFNDPQYLFGLSISHTNPYLFLCINNAPSPFWTPHLAFPWAREAQVLFSSSQPNIQEKGGVVTGFGSRDTNSGGRNQCIYTDIQQIYTKCISRQNGPKTQMAATKGFNGPGRPNFLELGQDFILGLLSPILFYFLLFIYLSACDTCLTLTF